MQRFSESAACDLEVKDNGADIEQGLVHKIIV